MAFTIFNLQIRHEIAFTKAFTKVPRVIIKQIYKQEFTSKSYD